MVDVLEISKVRRRHRPLKELDQTAREARVALEREIYRAPLVAVLLKFTPDQLQRIDDERRVAAYGNIPSRCATIRQLLDEALLWRKTMHPKPPRRSKGAPFEIDLGDI
jgi:hypothetical protein